jgi:hypothetical protein
MRKFVFQNVLLALLSLLGSGIAYSVEHEWLPAEATVTWTGGPDLAVPYFIPPAILNKDRNIITIQDYTANLGSSAAGASVTRYYLSETEPPFDITMARVVGERPVLALAADEESHGQEIVVPFPVDLGPGIYYLAACADDEKTVIELNEENNCSFTKLDSPKQIIVVAAYESLNKAPDCTAASLDTDKLWPPNHQLISVTIDGITDPDSDPVTIVIDSIQQDEPVNGFGDGDTSPDGFGVGTAQAELRAERSGTGNGRVYIISFTASDDKAASCSGVLSVGSPHDLGANKIPIDDGLRFDSTQP